MARILPPNSSRFFAHLPCFDAKACSACGTCLKKYPTEAISPENFETIANRCIRCFACVQACPKGARSIELKIKPVVQRFFKPARENPRQPV